ncbi:hypothetical protein GCM10007304_14160 [Rhodococcoides trifolii]|uniref:TraD/TraG TraM recognition site domain-containing protein n=2 Tax=Rhodococcoides trifolii TaxID=908250 RepID=A0A917FTY4_9NOCA|nr:hypothetical protein GCM10007304_14160 [Rhodococcus trifolii]
MVHGGATFGLLGLIALVYASFRFGRWVQRVDDPIPPNPVAALVQVASGDAVWPVASTATLIASLLTILVSASLVIAWRRQGRDHGVDDKAHSMASPKLLREVTGSQAAEKSARLRPTSEPGNVSVIGIEVARTVVGNRSLYMSWEDMLVCFAGTRMGKSSALAIPAMCAAPGPALGTSNKRDLHDHTRGVREELGTVWVSDLQHITGDSLGSGQPWWWNPLRDITNLKGAQKLASYFVSASREDSARVDAYFDGGAQELLALYMLAAAVGDGDLLHVYGWLSSDDNELAKDMLRVRGHQMAALRIETAQGLNPRQKDGLYDMARRFLAVLADQHYASSVLPPRRQLFDGDSALGQLRLTHDNPEFVPAQFASTTDTLYALSMEGPDSASPLTTALVGTVFDAATVEARRSPNGRLTTPLVAVLDEAANVCRLRELPKWYSHFGSQGINILTILQSPAQAAEVWGKARLSEMRQASNFHLYGGGLDDTDYLRELSTLVGDQDSERWTTSHSGSGLLGGRDSTSTSQSWIKEPILTVTDLAGLPKDRMLVISSGNAPILARKVFWSDTQWADAINRSLLAYGVATQPTSTGPVELTKSGSGVLP